MIFNLDCISGSKKIDDRSIDLIICDPPFGIQEASFDKHYKRDSDNIVAGYVEAPEDYYKFSLDWITQCHRILKDDGSMYIVSGWTYILDIMLACREANLHVINHIIWKFNFGVATTRKFVSSHYHILYLKKTSDTDVKFNLFSRFGSHEKNESGGSLLYQDLEDVWVINKEYQPGKVKNQNKLPEELVKKMILYSSNEGDMVCDFFMGNFTTAIVAKKLNRNYCGFEMNKNAFDLGISQLNITEPGSGIEVINNTEPENQGKPISKQEALSICSDFDDLLKDGMTQKNATLAVGKKYGRGRFSIKNVLDKYYMTAMPYGKQFRKTRGWTCPFCGEPSKVVVSSESLDEHFSCPCENGKRGWVVKPSSKDFSYKLL